MSTSRLRHVAVTLFLALLVVPAVQSGSTQEPPKESRVPDDDVDDPDLPGFLRGRIDKEEYHRLRQEHNDELRGLPFARKAGAPLYPRGDAIRQMDAREQAILLRSQSGEGFPPAAWASIGPAPIPNGQTSGRSDPVSGRTIAIAVHPTNANIAYAGTAQGGLYRTLDGGSTWTAIFDGAQSLVVGAVAIAPSNPSIVYVGTGENGQSADSYFGVGIYRIDNADTSPILNGPINPNVTTGTTTVITTGAFTGRAVSKILVHPADPATIFVATAAGVGGMGASGLSSLVPLGLRGVFRSTNATAAAGSVAFQKLTVTTAGGLDAPSTGNRSMIDMVFGWDAASPAVFPNPNVLLATTIGNAAAGDGGIFRSANALAATPTFTMVHQTTTNSARIELAIQKVGASVKAVAALGENTNGAGCTAAGQQGVLRTSTDGGITWSAPLAGGQGFCGGQCFYDIAIGIDPNDLNRIYLGGSAPSTCSSDYMIATDGGVTAGSFVRNNTGLHADTHAVEAISTGASSSTVYISNDGGIWKSTDSGLTWTSLNNTGFNATQFESLALHPQDREFMIGGTQDNGTQWRQPNANWTRADFGDGGFAQIDQNAGLDTTNVTMYHTYFNSVASGLLAFARVTSTADASDANWDVFGCGGTPNGINCSDTAVLFYAPLALGPGNPNTLYYGSDRLYRSTNSGTTMTVVSQGPLESAVAISAIGISPQNDNVRVVGMRFGKVFATHNGSSTMVNVTGSWPTGNVTPRPFVSRVVVDPNNPNVVYMTLATYGATTSKVWKTTNLVTALAAAGLPTWTAVGLPANGIPDVPVNAFVVDPRNSLNLFAGTDIGVFSSTDGGTSWSPFGAGLPRVAIFDMALHVPSGALRIASHGRGIWEIKAGNATAVFSNLTSATVSAGTSSLPLGGTLRAGSLIPPGSVSITVNGVTQSASISPSTGAFSSTFNPSAFANATYPISYSFAGDADYNAAAGSGSLTIGTLAATTTSLSAPAVTYPANGTVTVTVGSGSGTPTGIVNLSVDGGPALTQTLVSGQATFSLPGLSGGSHALVATYPAQISFNTSSVAGSLTVNKATPVFSSLSSATIILGQFPSALSGTLLAGAVAPMTPVSITLNGTTQTATPNSLGRFSSAFATSAIASGTYPIAYSFPGDTNFNAASGSGSFVVGSASATAIFSNSSPITIPDNAAGAPFPSNITVSGVQGTLAKVRVTLNGFSHTFVGDTSVLLVGPGGQSTVLTYQAGGSASPSSASFTFDDGGGAFTGAGTATYRPTQSGPVANFRTGAPTGPYGLNLFEHNRAAANGVWKLFVQDDFNGDFGAISGGWSLSLTTVPPISCPTIVAPGASFTTTVTSGASVTDWVALSTPGAPLTTFSSFQYVPLPRPQTRTFTAPMTVGTYELRLFENDTYTLLGSCQFPVSTGPTFSISDVTVTEGNAGTVNANFLVTLSPAATGVVTVQYQTADGTATAGSDYVARPLTTLTFNPGDAPKTVSVVVNGDTTPEATETFLVNLSNVVGGATIGDGQGLGTITTDDPIPVLTCPSIVAPGASFTTTVTAGASALDWVALTTPGAPPSTFSSFQYVPLPRPQTRTFTAPMTVGTYELRLFANDTYTLLGSCQFPVTTGPTFSINDVTVTEGNAGTVNANFLVTLSPAATGVVTVQYQTADGTATAGSDYVARPLTTLTFNPGDAPKTVSVVVNGDTTPEATETFLVNLSNVVGGATIGDGQGLGTITTDDPIPVLTCPSIVAPGASFTTTVSAGSSATDWVAMYPAGQVANSPFLTFQYVPLPRPQTRTFTAPMTVGTYELRLFANDGFTLLGSCQFPVSTGPTFSISDVTVTEGNAGTVNANFLVTLSPAATGVVTVQYQTADGTATAGTDYVARPLTTLTFNPGDAPKTVSVVVNGDTTPEATETFLVNLSNVVGGATIGDGQGLGTITTDDPIPVLTCPSIVAPGASFTTTVSAGSSATDWVAMYPAGQVANSPFLTFQYVPLPRPQTRTFTAPMTVGTYELRLFANDGFTLLGSCQFPVSTGPTFSIGDATVTEGNAGTVSANFLVTLSPAATGVVTVQYQTANGTATAGSDYVAVPLTTLTFNPGDPPKTVTVVVNGDTTPEATETFLVNLSNVVGGATIGDGQGQGTITTDDVIPPLTCPSIVAPNQSFTTTVSVGSSAADWVAMYPAGQVANSPFLTFQYVPLPRPQTRTFTAPATVGTYELRLFANDGFTLLGSCQFPVSTGPTFSINDVTVTEGNVGTVTANFLVTLSPAATGVVTVQYQTANGTATAGSDYVALPLTTLTFNPGDPPKTVTVVVNGDTTPEPTETFLVNLSNASAGSSIGDGQGLGTITTDDPIPVLTCPSIVAPGASFTTTVTAGASALDWVALTTPGAPPSTFSTFQYVPLPRPQTRTFTAPMTVGTYELRLFANDGFTLLGSCQFPVTAAPAVSISDVSLSEGNAGTVSANFTLTLSPAATGTVTVQYATADGTATAGSDYVAIPLTTLTFNATESTKTVTVLVNGDTTFEPTETLFVNLSNPSGVVILDAQGQATITNDDAQPTLSINDVIVTEGNTGPTNAVFAVTLSNPSQQTITVQYATLNGSATTANSDYVAIPLTTLTFNPGEVSKNLTVTVNGDHTFETNEIYNVNLSSPTNATLADGIGVGTINNDDYGPPGLFIGDIAVTEGNTGTTNAVFTVTLSNPTYQTVTVQYATGIGVTNPAGASDFVAIPLTTLTFAPGEVAKTITVVVNADRIFELNETYKVNLTSPTNAVFHNSSAVGTITNDDPLPGVSIVDSISVPEGNSGPTSASFSVSLSSPSHQTITVQYATLDGSATAGIDYVALPLTTLTFSPGEVLKSVPVTVNGDVDIEGNETFFLNLSNPANATVYVGTATGTIVNDDGVVNNLSVNDITVTEGNTGIVNASFTVTLSPAAAGTVTVNYATANGTALGQDFATNPYSNATSIAVGNNSAGSPYPSTISVPALTGMVSKVIVTLNNFTHTFPRDTDVLLVGPTGQKVLLMSDVGGGSPIATGVTLTLRDDASASLPSTALASGAFKPTDISDGEGDDLFPASAPAGPYATALSAFNGQDPAGTWSLYVRDDFVNDTGSFAGGWALTIITTGDYVPVSGGLTFTAGQTTKTVVVPIRPDSIIEADETFFVNLSGASGATILDSQGLGTITNDDCADTDGDRLCDTYETNTGVYVSATNTGTSPSNPDTDADGINDGDEVLGTLAGLNLPAMGTNPLKKNILMEYDWFDDAQGCALHSHRPTQAMVDRVTAAFAASTNTNPDGTTGIAIIHDFGQGGAFTGGNFISDADGDITGGVNGADFIAIKGPNFASNRNGYFHYVINAHNYTDSIGSSGQAELPGDDLIVSLNCAISTNNIANTIMHELGHNLNIQHGGNESCNWKPNYNSVMNYRFQFPGVDTSCNAVGNSGETNVLDYSRGLRPSLNENALNENSGVCGTPGIDWNFINGLESSIVYDLNRTSTSPNVGTAVDNAACAATLTTLNDSNDWANVVFTGLTNSDGARVVEPTIITCDNRPPDAGAAPQRQARPQP